MPLKILVSSLPLPPVTLGSWTNRMMNFQNNLGYFDKILSPTQHPDSTFLFCQKRALKVWEKIRGNRADKIYASFIVELIELASNQNSVKILVVDDQNLLDAVTRVRERLPKNTEINYSHHGHQLSAPIRIFDRVDKVFFLTQDGYEKTVASNYQFTPEVHIVGNGVVGDEFKPLSQAQKTKCRTELGYGPDDLIISWMANARPVKGLHIFKKVISRLLETYPNLKIISIGHELDTSIKHKGWKQVGRISNASLPPYLQISDVYFFTALWQEGFGLSLAEAVKCGNWAIASHIGGIPTVLKDVPNKVFVKEPNIVREWVEAFDQFLELRENGQLVLPKKQLDQLHNYPDWEKRFISALES